jgi:hypothetical protein
LENNDFYDLLFSGKNTVRIGSGEAANKLCGLGKDVWANRKKATLDNRDNPAMLLFRVRLGGNRSGS